LQLSSTPFEQFSAPPLQSPSGAGPSGTTFASKASREASSIMVSAAASAPTASGRGPGPSFAPLPPSSHVAFSVQLSGAVVPHPCIAAVASIPAAAIESAEAQAPIL
jgi:hypothetical protein